MHQGPVKDKPITRHLGCTLEELYSGSTRKMKITRTIFDGSGRVTRSEEEILELNVKPGWKKGTKLTFQQKGEMLVLFGLSATLHWRFWRSSAHIF
jgi:DnaJ family protein B protein 4